MDMPDHAALGPLRGLDPLRNAVLTKKTENGDPKKIVAEDELARHLAEGWDVQTVLPSGKILIRK